MRYHTCFWYYFCIHTIYTISFALCKLRHATTDHIWPCRCRCNAWHVNVLCHPAGTLGFGVASFQGLCLLLSDGVFGFIRGLLWGRVEGYVFGTLYIWVISSRLKWAMCFFFKWHISIFNISFLMENIFAASRWCCRSWGILRHSQQAEIKPPP